MEIPLDLARTLAAVIDEGTFDAAARRLRITPSAVSQRVKALEQQLGRVLVVRSKPVRPTEAGAADRAARPAVGAARARRARRVRRSTSAAIRRPAGLGAARGQRRLARDVVPAGARAGRGSGIRSSSTCTATTRTSPPACSSRAPCMGAVTSQATPVAGCLVRPLGVMRYEAVATPAFVDALGSRRRPGAPMRARAPAPVVDFDRRDDLQREYLVGRGVDPERPPRHYVPASNDFATAIKLGLGWGLLPAFQSTTELERGDLVRLGGPPVDVPLYWQQWNLRSPLLDAIADAVIAEARANCVPELRRSRATRDLRS